MIGSLYTVREKDLLCRILLIFRIFAGNHFFERLVEADAQMALSPAGKQDLDQGDLRHKSKAEFPGKCIGVISCVIFQVVDTSDDRFDSLLFHCFGQCIDVFIMGVKCRFVDECQFAQLLDCYFFERLFGSQLDKCVLDCFFCFFNSKICFFLHIYLISGCVHFNL